MIKKGPKIAKLLNKIFPPGCEMTRAQRRRIDREQMIERAQDELARLRAVRVERSKLPDWYDELSGEKTPLAAAIKGVGYTVFLSALDGDMAAAKLFFEAYKTDFKPTQRRENTGSLVRIILSRADGHESSTGKDDGGSGGDSGDNGTDAESDLAAGSV